MENKCEYFDERYVDDHSATRNSMSGETLYRRECRCNGTKERELCQCEGDCAKCDFCVCESFPKPCPCCGAKASVKSFSDGDNWLYWITCEKCGLLTKVCDDEKEAFVAWNRRVNE